MTRNMIRCERILEFLTTDFVEVTGRTDMLLLINFCNKRDDFIVYLYCVVKLDISYLIPLPIITRFLR